MGKFSASRATEWTVLIWLFMIEKKSFEQSQPHSPLHRICQFDSYSRGEYIIDVERGEVVTIYNMFFE